MSAGAVLAAIGAGRAAAAGSGRPEAVLREHVQPVLAEVLAERGARSRARDEVHLAVPAGSLADDLDAPLSTQGRADAIYNRFVIEFEPPGSLRPSVMHSATRHAVAQVQQYLRGIAEADGIAFERVAGCSFDGDLIVYVAGERDGWRVSRPQPVDTGSLGELLDTLEALSVGRGLSSVNLEEDFGRGSAVGTSIVGALFRALDEHPSARSDALFAEWRGDLGATGSLSVADENAWVELCADMDVPGDAVQAPRVLFALQTYFALVAKLTALVVLQGVTGQRLIDEFDAEDDIWSTFARLESGDLTAGVGALNVVEPGVFSWYVEERSDALAAGLSRGVAAAKEYSAEVLELSPLAARDVLKGLYQTVVPPSIRHRLGEYYTPDWLVQHVISTTTQTERELDPRSRVLDPACGSGSFLVEVLARMIASREARRFSQDELLDVLTKNVVGFDVSPLAVQAAKVSYLVALAPLLSPDVEGLTIPVYLADSVAPPRAGNILEGDVFAVSTSIKRWRIPAALCTPDGLRHTGEVLRDAVDNAQSADWVLDQLSAEVSGFDRRAAGVAEAVRDSYESLAEFERDGKNGIWWEIIRNGFAPTLQEPFDFVVGNPPWVSWETLAEEYRVANQDQWDLYRLNPDLGVGRRQASSRVRLDLAMLFVAHSTAAYLRNSGRLGFVITITPFHSELGGRGFRRAFRPSDASYAFVHLEDLRTLNVFEGPGNQPSVVTVQKEGPTSFPVPVTRWQARGSRTVPFNASLDQVLADVERISLSSEPVDPADPASPWAVMPEEALAATRSVRRASPYLEDVREGINTRGANGILFVEVLQEAGERLRIRNVPRLGRDRSLEAREGWVEREVVKALLRGEDVSRDQAAPRYGVIFFHDAAHLSRPIPDREAAVLFPEAYEFMSSFRDRLRSRTRFRGWDPSGDDWLGLYSVTSAAVAEHKVVIREIASGMIAKALHSADVVPDHKLHVIRCTSAPEADALAITLNSPVVDYIVRSFSLSTSLTGSLLRYIGIRRYTDGEDESTADAIAARGLGLTDSEYLVLRQALEEELGTAA